MSQAEPGDYKGVGKNEEADWAAMRSACVLDLVLRLLLLWTSMEAYDVLTGWITELLKLVGRARACVRSEEGECSTANLLASSRKQWPCTHHYVGKCVF